MKAIVLKIILEIIEDKKAANLFPYHALDIEIERKITKIVHNVLKQLYKEGSIDFGKTMNNNFVELSEPGKPKNKTQLHQLKKV